MIQLRTPILNFKAFESQAPLETTPVSKHQLPADLHPVTGIKHCSSLPLLPVKPNNHRFVSFSDKQKVDSLHSQQFYATLLKKHMPLGSGTAPSCFNRRRLLI